jgi:hypothetical protein
MSGPEAMKILSENVQPIVLSTRQVACDLPLNLEYEGFLENQCCESSCLFLRFENIFGSIQCPNYNLFLHDAEHPNARVRLGILPFVGVPSRSAGNFHGAAQTVKMDRNATRLAIASLLSSRRLTLLLQGQHSPSPDTQAVIELVYLCLQPEETFIDG